ncbi:long-chain acyl-CoA synthetase [Marinicella pacifica]|uniref:Long-chain acyl-CoA synthetase n=1 Tax=Marinicella pacifica TaxID=1171543 RepID=A0A917CH70_9GAMM|nr:AMP-binding protein [Marinicella pacifica]GGF87697.1 long-chain acyl-CoA synthetase [Marinicella pacifica]
MPVDKLKMPISMLRHWAQKTPGRIYLSQPTADDVITYTWSEVYDQVARMAQYLSQYPAGSHMAIFSLNCAHWLMADLAIQMAGHITIPIYPTASKETIKKILSHSDASLLMVGKLPDADITLDKLPHDIAQLSFYQKHPDRPFWSDIVNTYQPLKQAAAVKADDLISIVYTSGTTGDPKGVMVSYRAVNAALDLIKNIIVVTPDDRFVSYLPMAHVAERMAIAFASVFYGAQVSFIHSLDTFTDHVKMARPTIFFGVPRIWSNIKYAVEQQSGGSKVLNTLLCIPLLNRLLSKLIRKQLGFSEVRFALCAAAAVDKEVLSWYRRLGLKLNEAYGLSETCGLSHMVKPNQDCLGYVGQVIPGCECTLSDAGEILLRNPALMTGYYKQPELTAKVIDNEGWLHTGDLGQINEKGFLAVIGRTKDIFKTAKGQYIAPAPIEMLCQKHLNVDHVIAMGSGYRQPFLLISVAESVHQNDLKNFQEFCRQQLPEINRQLEPHQRISHIFICADAWTPESGLLTPTLKIKRSTIEQHYLPILTHKKKQDVVII